MVNNNLNGKHKVIFSEHTGAAKINPIFHNLFHNVSDEVDAKDLVIFGQSKSFPPDITMWDVNPKQSNLIRLLTADGVVESLVEDTGLGWDSSLIGIVIDENLSQ